MNDTIAAIATPLGEGAIGIVRVSGPGAVAIAEKLFVSRTGADWRKQGSHRLFYGVVVDPATGQPVDEVLLGVMYAPRTFTREDVVEFNCHGGIVPLRRTLELVLQHGARLAEPGEFTRRAFLNGRLDLAQAESILDIIRAKTEDGLAVAMSLLAGELSSRVRAFQDQLLGLVARVEASIDFPEEGIEEATREDMVKSVRAVMGELEELLRQARYGKVYREGLRTVIVGRPNVGKSSLLNSLLREKRAIVTEIPGTTRDIIEEMVNIRGIPIRLADTAGLRNTDDIVERIGVERSRDLVKMADLVLVVLDASTGLTPEDRSVLELVREQAGIVLVNKSDIGDGEALARQVGRLFPDKPVKVISVKTGEGLDQLEEAIEKMVLDGRAVTSQLPLVSHVRHKQALARCYEHLQEVLRALSAGENLDLAAIDLRAAWEALGEITGTTVAEDIVDRIFRDFCIGK
ncbi:tRNA modification GTPase [Desulfofundulus luciae]|uniref:tRNA modification GTPase MnmE n=1 Tax=Desulfofundulus luciae TaxID=74702 RepID=A0ABU0AWU1_9FIRM|nr:tRNA modification GTPase [Desulfofundulus luciae]